MASDTPERMLAFVETVRELIRNPRPGCVKIAGSHLEGPYMDFGHKGGMNPALIRDPDPAEVRKLLDAAQGTLKIMTISPELPGALEVTRMLAAEGVLVSGGHTGLAPDKVEDFIAAGFSPEQYRLIRGEGGPKYKIRFRILELFASLGEKK